MADGTVSSVRRVSDTGNPGSSSPAVAPSAASQRATGSGPVNGATTGDQVQLSQPGNGHLVEQLLETQGPGAPSAEEAAQLEKTLGVVDAGALQLLAKQGTKIGVVNPGEDMYQMGVLREVDMQQMQQNMPTYQKQLNQLDAQLDARFAAPMADLQKQMQGLAADDPKRQELDLQLARLQGQRTYELSQGIEAGGIPARPLLAPLSAKEAANPELAQMASQVVESPLPTSAMADIHGANTPERLQEFEQLMQGLNGDRLTAARAEGLEGLKARVEAAKTPEDRQRLQGYLDAALQDPTQIPIDHRAHNIVVPNVHYVDHNGQTSRLPLHDRVSLNNWGDGGTGAAPEVNPNTGEGSVLKGQYFEDMNRVLVRDSRLDSDTPVHEIGHAIEGAVQRGDPQYYADFEPRLREAYQQATRGTTVSAYAQSSPREYIAEGVAHYYEDPKALNAADPALYALTQELLSKANLMGSQ